MQYAYLIKLVSHNTNYVDYTNNLSERLAEHNNGDSNFTRKYLPWELFILKAIVPEPMPIVERN